MDKKRVYCHTTCNDYNSPQESFLEGNWYEIYQEVNNCYSIQRFKYDSFDVWVRNFYKAEFFVSMTAYTKDYYRFSDYFYTEQEYYREKNLDKLLNG